VRDAPVPSCLAAEIFDATASTLIPGALECLTKPFREQELLVAVQEAINRECTMRRRRAELTELRRAYESLRQRAQFMPKMRSEFLARLVRIAGRLGLLPPPR